jgi:hypothetical protein
MRRRKVAHLASARVRRCLRSAKRGFWLAAQTVMFNKRSSFRSSAVIFGLGAAVGAALALLYAPMTGRKMQRKIVNATEKVRDVVEDSVGNVQNVLRKVANA